MDREELIINLYKLGQLNDPIVKSRVDKFSKVCPTCGDREKYVYEGKTYECDCVIEKLLYRNYLAANIGVKFHSLTLDDFISEERDKIVPKVEKYLKNLEFNLREGIGITLHGELGTGKTMVMTHILKECLKKGIGAYFIHFNDLITAVGQQYKNDEDAWLDNKMRYVPILGIDELRTDARNGQGFLSDTLEHITRFRTDNNLPTLLTTNLNANQQESIFKKSYSLLAEKNTLIETNGTDVRGTLIKANKKLYNESKPLA